MNDLLVHTSLALGTCQPLDLWGAERLADQLLASLDVLLRVFSSLLNLPVLGVALVPAFVAFGTLTTLGALVLVVGLLAGSALLSGACVDLGAPLAQALLALSELRHLLGEA